MAEASPSGDETGLSEEADLLRGNGLCKEQLQFDGEQWKLASYHKLLNATCKQEAREEDKLALLVDEPRCSADVGNAVTQCMVDIDIEGRQIEDGEDHLKTGDKSKHCCSESMKRAASISRGKKIANSEPDQRTRNSLDIHENNVDRKFRNRQQTRGMSLTRLIELADSCDHPDELLSEISSRKSGFVELLDCQIQPDYFIPILKILSVCMNSTSKKTLINILDDVNHHFLNKLNAALGDISVNSEAYRTVWGDKNMLQEVCVMIIQILNVLVQTFNSALGRCKSVITLVKELSKELQDGESLLDEIKSIGNAIIAENKTRKKKKESTRLPLITDKEERVDYFRLMSVQPTLSDIQTDKMPFLREIVCKGEYEDLETYLDTHFRLLREDFMQPLRIGISDYLLNQADKKATRGIREIRLYQGVRIINPVCTEDGICYNIKFDTHGLHSVDWKISRRLLYGSLLCLSSDNFKTVWFATVKDRDVLKLEKGLICVHFDTIPNKNVSECFVMAESTAFFEAYKHVLLALQYVDSSLPFQRYIIDCNSTLKPPGYLLVRNVPFYDFSCIVPSDETNVSKIPVLNTARWPLKEDLGLDICQYNALRLALTKELAIIQGPPGTGKTFIGLKIAQMLISNKKFWKNNNGGSPILVVCYTNHALDQFLEGILKFCKTGIVRVGGRCKSEALLPYTFRQIKRSKRKSSSLQECEIQLASCHNEIKLLSSNLKHSFSEILPFEQLQGQMTEEQRISFDNTGKCEGNIFFEWLGMRPPLISPEEGCFDENDCARNIWISYILESTDIMPISEKDSIADVCSISHLYDRARLYKRWMSELKENILRQKRATAKRYRHFNGNNTESLDELLGIIRNTIAYPRQFIKHMSSPTSRKQLNSLMQDKEFEKWLGLDSSENATTAIGCIISNRTNNDTGSDADIEDERELENEGNDFLFDYSDTNNEHTCKRGTNAQWIWDLNSKEELEKLQTLFNSAIDISTQQAERLYDVWSSKIPMRRNLYRYWVCKYRKRLKEKLQELEQTYTDLIKPFRKCRIQDTADMLKTANVIGMTTTGAAKHLDVLQSTQPAILIVEEAAEVLESHIITALSPGCKHLLLIGDHKQLRPSTTVFELARHYHLDISLFERMVRNGIPSVTLSEQHRMRPEISTLLRNNFLYPHLRDHKIVFKYEDVRGINSNVFFIDHDKSEVSSSESTSYQNPHEAKYIAQLCKYLLKQGYSGNEITVLTPYMGQITLLRSEMQNEVFSDVRLTAVDNFQGEENEIILLSLVRSKACHQVFFKKNPIGFLAISNRICVSLSRAKKGMYVVGNFSLIKNHSKLWSHMIDQMMQLGRVGTYISLRCQNHPDNIIKAETPGDFDAAPHGGCRELCSAKLECNHNCPIGVCHIIDKEHKHINCEELCQKMCADGGHKCLKRCQEPCGRCEIIVEKEMSECGHAINIPCHQIPLPGCCFHMCTFRLECKHECQRRCGKCYISMTHEQNCQVSVLRKLKCGHDKNLKCYQDIASAECEVLCAVELPCGHIMQLECHKDPSTIQCKVMCSVQLPCGHCVKMHCYRDPTEVQCTEMCDVKLLCGHTAKLQCYRDPTEVQCNEMCDVKLSCGHTVKKHCYRDPTEVQCNEMCDVKLSCGHTANLQCYRDPAKVHCNEMCDVKLFCGHTIKQRCFQDPSEANCTEPCKTTLTCGHSCSGTCGSCLRGKIHQPCKETCQKWLPCGHKCSYRCCDFCPPCMLPCEWICSHGIRCSRKCSEVCRSCQKKCSYGCIHIKCTKRCYENCDDIRCDERCHKKLKCGHVCAGLCGEVCICAEFCNKRKHQHRSKKDGKTVLIKLNNCGCIFPKIIMDKHMSQTSHIRGELLKTCPKCRTPISSFNRRYSNIMKQAAEDILNKFREVSAYGPTTTGRINSMYRKMIDLESIGLGYNDRKILKKWLSRKQLTAARLGVIEKTLEMLQEFLNAVQLFETDTVEACLEVDKIKTIILMEREYGTTQLWIEIRNEIKRIQYFAKLRELNERHGDKSKGRIMENLYKVTMEMLKEDKPLTNKRMSVIEKVIAKL